MRRLLVVTVSILLGGCGGGGSASSPAAPPLGLQRAERARACLSDAGFRVLGGPRSPGDRNAPDVELIVRGKGADAFLAFYKQVERARHYENDLRRNAKRINGSVERRGSVSVVWVRKPPAEARRIERCAF
jgi:hypothetical protein